MTLTLWNKVSENTLQHPKPSSRVALFVALQGFKVGNNAINMKVNKGLLAFMAKEEVTVLVVVHEEVFGEDAGAEGVAEEGGGGRRFWIFNAFFLALWIGSCNFALYG